MTLCVFDTMEDLIRLPGGTNLRRANAMMLFGAVCPIILTYRLIVQLTNLIPSTFVCVYFSGPRTNY